MILGAKFLKASECKNGDIITIKDEGKWVESNKFSYEDGSPKMQCQFTIKIGGEEKTITLNKTNREALIAVWGKDTGLWIDKEAEITIKTIEVAGEDRDVIRLKPL